MTLPKCVNEFSVLLLALHRTSPRAADKLLNAVRSFAENGECDSNADEDSVCGGI